MLDCVAAGTTGAATSGVAKTELLIRNTEKTITRKDKYFTCCLDIIKWNLL